MATVAGAEEEVLGVLSLLRYKLTDYDVIFTNSRIVAIKTGAAPIAELAAMFDGTAGGDRRSTLVQGKHSSNDIDRLVSAHPKNFELRFERVKRARFNAGVSMLTMPMLRLWTDQGKVFFVFMKSSVRKEETQVRLAKALLDRALGEKVEFRHV